MFGNGCCCGCCCCCLFVGALFAGFRSCLAVVVVNVFCLLVHVLLDLDGVWQWLLSLLCLLVHFLLDLDGVFGNGCCCCCLFVGALFA